MHTTHRQNIRNKTFQVPACQYMAYFCARRRHTAGCAAAAHPTPNTYLAVLSVAAHCAHSLRSMTSCTHGNSKLRTFALLRYKLRPQQHMVVPVIIVFRRASSGGGFITTSKRCKHTEHARCAAAGGSERLTHLGLTPVVTFITTRRQQAQ
jgi:hypothetical protein